MADDSTGKKLSITLLIKILITIVITISLTFTIVISFSEKSGPDFSGEYIAAKDFAKLIAGETLPVPRARLSLRQSKNSFSGYVEVVPLGSPKFRYEIVEGYLDKENHLNLALKLDPEMEVSISGLGLGLSGPAFKAFVTTRSTGPLISPANIIEMDGITEIGGALGTMIGVISAMTKGDPNFSKRERITFYKLPG